MGKRLLFFNAAGLQIQRSGVSGNGNSYTTEFRQYDPRLMRWKSLDPLMHQFPWMSPYVAFDNNPIYYIDPYGLASEGGDDKKLDKAERAAKRADAKANRKAERNGTKEVNNGAVSNVEEVTVSAKKSSSNQETNEESPYLQQTKNRANNAISTLSKPLSLDYNDLLKTTVVEDNMGFEINKFLANGGKIITVASLDAAFTTDGYSKVNELLEINKKGYVLNSNGTVWNKNWKTGNQYVSKETVEATKKAFNKTITSIKIVKGVGVVMTFAGGAISFYQWVNNEMSDGKFAADVTFSLITFIPGVGWIVSGVYFSLDATIGWDNIMRAHSKAIERSGNNILNAFPAGF